MIRMSSIVNSDSGLRRSAAQRRIDEVDPGSGSAYRRPSIASIVVTV
jgi:hypothetical protein